MVKWFPDRKGFATGMVAAGYGFGAIATTFPISYALGDMGFDQTLTTFGIGLLVCGVLISFGIRPPRENEIPQLAPASFVGHRNFSSREMLRTPIFWTMWFMMTLMASGGLMVISQFALFAKDFGAATAVVLGLSALPLALTIDRLANGVTRPFFGWISDRIGREQTMFIAFVLEAAAIGLLLRFGSNPLALVLLSGLVFFGWGEIFSLFPSTLTDTFGTKHAATNYGFLLIAQGLGSIIGGPLASVIREQTQSWSVVFGIVIVFDLVSAIMAVAVLAPLRRQFFENMDRERQSLAPLSA
jgi:oxalate/formate antiporter